MSTSGPKRRFSMYSMMLIISFLALVTASWLLHLELVKWGPIPQWKTGSIAVPSR